MPNIPKLIHVFEDVRRLIDDPENNFDWSFWEDSAMALRDIDGFLSVLRAGRVPKLAAMEVLFAPTGPLQEVSLSSGWGAEFLDVSNRFDAAIADTTTRRCPCQEAPLHVSTLVKELGMDSHFAEVSVLTCPNCGTLWLRYHFENEAESRSGRWFVGEVSPEDVEALSADSAKKFLEGVDWYYFGGSWFKGETGRTSGPIDLST